MKILQKIGCEECPDGCSVRAIPDSALLKGGKPVFLPYEEHTYRLSVGVALVIGKLGKGFAPRFAERYVEHVAPVAVFDDLTLPPADALAWSFDGAVDIGVMLPADTLTSQLTFHLNPLRRDSWKAVNYPFSPHQDMGHWREALSSMARTMTFKTGDMVIFAREFPVDATPDSRLTAYISPQPLCEITNIKHHDTILDFNIK